MENQGKSKTLLILLIIFIILTLILGGYILYDKVIIKDEIKTEESNNNSNPNESETIIKEVSIKNAEIEELYKYVQSSSKSFSVCLGEFYLKPFKNHSLSDKVSLVLINYAENFKKPIDNSIAIKLDSQNGSEYYIEPEIVKNGMKYLYNIQIDNFDNKANYAWEYNSDLDLFLDIPGGGDYGAKIVEKIIDYNELDNEINLTTVKAEIGYDTNSVYRYYNDENTLVFKGLGDSFDFTEENVNKFPQLKYIFKKNEKGSYYLYDIVNLNFEEDFEDCNY